MSVLWPADSLTPLPTARPAIPRLGPQSRPAVHLVGVCGAGMKALAELLLGWGWRLSASDQQPATAAIRRLTTQGLQFTPGHSAEGLPESAELLVYSPAIPLDNIERLAARSRGLLELSYPQFLGQLNIGRQGLCIAGTHGKSTTTAMVGRLLDHAGRQPTVIVGAEDVATGVSGQGGQGPAFVVESCEFQRAFLELTPQIAAILNVEPDHFDCYSDLGSLVDAFARFAGRVAAGGTLIARGDCPLTMQAITAARCDVQTFGWSADCDWRADDLRRTAIGTRFRAYFRGQYFGELALRVPGRHNVLNALAATAVCAAHGISPRQIRDGLIEFLGVRRRFETQGNWRGVTWVDDYAHHPTAIRATLQTAREVFGRRRIVVAFQPHQVSRVEALRDQFCECFGLADEVLILPAFAAREKSDGQAAAISNWLASALQQRVQSARFCPSLDELTEIAETECQPGDVWLTIGAGDIDQVYHGCIRPVLGHSHTRRAFGAPYLAEARRPRAVLPHSA